MAGKMKSNSWNRRKVNTTPLTPAILKAKKEAKNEVTKGTIKIEGDTYNAQINEDDDCPVSIWR